MKMIMHEIGSPTWSRKSNILFCFSVVHVHDNVAKKVGSPRVIDSPVNIYFNAIRENMVPPTRENGSNTPRRGNINAKPFSANVDPPIIFAK